MRERAHELLGAPADMIQVAEDDTLRRPRGVTERVGEGCHVLRLV